MGAQFQYGGLLGGDGVLTAGEMSAAKTWIFNNPTFASFSFSVDVYGVAPQTLSKRAALLQTLQFRVDGKTGRIVSSGAEGETAVVALPETFALYQNYPNPFNPETTIRYALPEDAEVSLVIYNLLGERVRMLVSGRQNAGYGAVRWDGKDEQGADVAIGVYVCTLHAGEFVQIRKMALIR